MILVTGASGNVGGDLVPLLLSRGAKVRVLVRDERKVAHLAGTVERVTGDLGKPETLTRAFADVESFFLMTTDHDGGTTFVTNAAAAAKAAGVRHVVYLSSLSAVRPTTLIGKWHRAREQVLEATPGLAWTFLRPGAFMSNTLQWAGSIKAQGAVYLPNADRPVYPIDSLDMAAVAAVALTQDGHEGKAYPLTGDERLTARDQVNVLARVLGKPIRVVEVTPEKAKEGMARSGMPPLLVEAVDELIRSDWDEEEGAAAMVRELTGRAPSTFEAWVKRHLAAFT